MSKKETLIDLLLSKKMLTPAQVEKINEEVKKTGLSIEKALETMGYVRKEDIINVLSESAKTAYIDLKDYIVDPEIIRLVPEAVARKYSILPLFKVGDTLTIATTNPQDIISIDEIRMKTRIPAIEAVLASEDGIAKAIEQYYAVKGDINDILQGMDSIADSFEVSAEERVEDTKSLEKAAEEAPVDESLEEVFQWIEE